MKWKEWVGNSRSSEWIRLVTAWHGCKNRSRRVGEWGPSIVVATSTTTCVGSIICAHLDVEERVMDVMAMTAPSIGECSAAPTIDDVRSLPKTKRTTRRHCQSSLRPPNANLRIDAMRRQADADAERREKQKEEKSGGQKERSKDPIAR